MERTNALHILRYLATGTSINSLERTNALHILRYLATGTSINSLERTNALHSSQGSVENYIKNVAAALNSLAQDEVCFEFDPNTIGTTKQGFADYGDSWLVSGH